MPENITEILNNASKVKHNFYTAIKVSQMLDDFNVNITNLSKVISADYALTATILKHCNSAQYSFARKITTINDAISVIGFKILKTIIFTIVTKASFMEEISGYGMMKGDLWKNSISCAVYSKYIAGLINYDDPDQAFTAGLLKDIGKTMLNDYVKKHFKQIMDLCINEKIAFSDAEEKIIGYSHSQIGGLVAEKWKFPKILIDTIKYHHNPEEAENNDCEDLDLIRIVHISDSISSMMGHGIGLDSLMYNVDASCFKKLGLKSKSENIESLISEMVNLNPEISLLNSSI
ncbi:MAG TPA: HDOD domain-containing protein [Candidatus Gastranaerophilales bacterium]|nr:HDOD domain-containing protein [Candidatus Gastranaerophilales bacterium]